MMKSKLYLSVVLLLLVFLSVNFVNAQDINRVPPLEITCGDIIEGEFVTALEERTYTLNAAAGTTVDIAVNAISDQPRFIAMVTDPSNFGIAIRDGQMRSGRDGYYIVNVQSQVQIEDLILAATGAYTIRLANFEFSVYSFEANRYSFPRPEGGVGAYTLTINCIDRNGNPILPPEQSPDPLPAPVQPTASLIPDLSSVALIPLIAGVPMGGGVAIDPGAPTAYIIEGSEGQQLTLSLQRLAGNLNLGVVVLAPNNEALSFASLIGGGELSLSATLPTSGSYTVGIFRVDIAPPAVPEPTAFQIQATLSG
jgi:hypothetical protein